MSNKLDVRSIVQRFLRQSDAVRLALLALKGTQALSVLRMDPACQRIHDDAVLIPADSFTFQGRVFTVYVAPIDVLASLIEMNLYSRSLSDLSLGLMLGTPIEHQGRKIVRLVPPEEMVGELRNLALLQGQSARVQGLRTHLISQLARLASGLATSFAANIPKLKMLREHASMQSYVFTPLEAKAPSTVAEQEALKYDLARAGLNLPVRTGAYGTFTGLFIELLQVRVPVGDSFLRVAVEARFRDLFLLFARLQDPNLPEPADWFNGVNQLSSASGLPVFATWVSETNGQESRQLVRDEDYWHLIPSLPTLKPQLEENVTRLGLLKPGFGISCLHATYELLLDFAHEAGDTTARVLRPQYPNGNAYYSAYETVIPLGPTTILGVEYQTGLSLSAFAFGEGSGTDALWDYNQVDGFYLWQEQDGRVTPSPLLVGSLTGDQMVQLQARFAGLLRRAHPLSVFQRIRDLANKPVATDHPVLQRLRSGQL